MESNDISLESDPNSIRRSEGSFLEITCRFDEGSNYPRYFVPNDQRRGLFINSVPIDINTTVALPDFAVIEISGTFFFWWGTQEAVDFVPEARSAVRNPSSEIDYQWGGS